MIDFIRFVESQLPDGSPEMLVSRVLPSFLASVHKNGIQEMSGIALRIWVVEMLSNGININTCRRYVGTLHTLYKIYSGEAAATSDPFADLKLDIANSFANPDPKVSDHLRMLTRLLKKGDDSSDRVTANVILYLFYNVNTSVADVVNLKFGECGTDCPQIDDLVNGMRLAPQSKYVFPLGQGKRRAPAIARDLISDMHATLRLAGIDFGGSFSRDNLTSLWIASAIGCGIPLVRIRSIVRNLPPDFSFLSLLPFSPTDPRREAAVVNKVAESFNDKSVRWYVMRLRSGVSPEEITGSFSEDDLKKDSELTFYYPVRKEVRKENRKRVTVKTPYLPGLLFFRLRSDKVGRFMSRIGALAWCYRVTNSPDSPYSYITCREMMAFQRHIGDFTPDIEMEVVNNVPPVCIGDRVRINGGGLFDGLEGVVRSTENIDGSVTYTLRLSDTSFIKWDDIRVKEAFVEPLQSTFAATV